MSQVSQTGLQSNWLYAFWKFSRPHTIYGTSLSVLGLYVVTIALTNSDFPFPNSYSLLSVIGAWIACLSGNVYIVGLNQLQDVEIDKINKPHLPVASGEFTQRTGEIIVIIAGVLALGLSWLLGPFLFAMVAISLAIGTAYSLPPIRLKRFPFWAAICIFSVRGAIVNLGLFLHFSWVIEAQQIVLPAVWTLTWFILVFTIAIAIFKDIPDMEGDRQFNITTFTIKLGKQNVFNLSLWLLTACYAGMILVGLLDFTRVNSIFLIAAHSVILAFMWWCTQQTDLQDKSSITRAYKFIWKLFYLEYLIFPISCLLG
ncbi:MAG: homogentisate phytyltransferase [Rivularia sp. ALOHA_DT_140]|nr:homogentisate phytyltransferase [Rivularia sp. ALOHA_DT_140]